MPSYKLYYFDARGRAEVIRMMFASKNEQFEDIRVKSEDWPKYKQEMPQGKLPVLEEDGVKIPQSGAIIRYVAKKLDMAGSTDIEIVMCDAIVETINEVLTDLRPLVFNKDVNEEKKKNFETKTLPEFEERIEKMLTQNKSGKGYLIGSKMTVADIAFFDSVYEIKRAFPNILQSKPTLKGVYDMVEKSLSDYISKRPETKF